MNIKIYPYGLGVDYPETPSKELLGGKGYGLKVMAHLGLPVPPGFTLPCDLCQLYLDGKIDMDDVMAEVAKWLPKLKEVFGYMPLVSIRSGARVSMPGQMDTILNVGLTPDNLDEWAERLGKRAALDSMRRLLQMYGETVYGIPAGDFAKELEKVKLYKYGMGELPQSDKDLSEEHLVKLIDRYGKVYEAYGFDLPSTPEDQICGAIKAVWGSWNTERAIAYRKEFNIPDSWGTAVNVCSMVFGNMNDQSATGVLFTRNPSTGEPGVMGEFLVNAQGEDVVAGIRTPDPLSSMSQWNAEVTNELFGIAAKMELHHRDMQDMEFTVQDGKLWLLQTRTGKRSAKAAFRIAHDLAQEKLITQEEALKRVTGKQYLTLLKPVIDPSFKVEPTGVGIPASAGLVSGIAVFSKEAAIASKEPCILITKETTPDDFPGMVKSQGILTALGGQTSHAAVVARGMDKACVVGLTELVVTEDGATLNGQSIAVGTPITLDGSTGRVWVDTEVPVTVSGVDGYVKELLSWGKQINALIDVSVGHNAVDHIPTSGRAFINTTKYVKRKNPTFCLGQLRKALKERPELSGIIALLDAERDVSFQQDDEVMGLMAVTKADTGNPNGQCMDQAVEALIKATWTQKLKKAWAIQLPSWATASHAKTLREAGWKLVTKAKNLGEFLKADGYVDYDTATFKKFCEEQGIEWADLFGLMEAAGKTIEPLPKVMSETRMVFEMLG